MEQELKIRKTTVSDFENILLFNQKVYPNKTRIKECLNFWLSKSPDTAEKSIVLVDSQNNIKGQMFVSEMAYFYKGQKVDSVWEYDLIVDEKLRKSAWGVDLLLYCMDIYPNSCSTGSGPQALPVHLKLGQIMLGEIRKYVTVGNPIFLLTSFCRREIKRKGYPDNISANGIKFNKVKSDALPDIAIPFNNQYFEITREKSFLKWRFFSDIHNYAFYKDSNSDCFFVVRTISKNRVTSLVLVDYRFSITHPEMFEAMVSALRKIANKLHLSVMICGSSFKEADQVLERNHFKSVGRPRPVLGFLKCKDRKEDISKRNFCFVTLADSDGETNW